ncbi:hypothetical protein CGRA01v4_14669 [Colletotrichum graminicola]|nr:hypothetical protein CGRA01v4_14669 [Colletotrichum graminicola]
MAGGFDQHQELPGVGQERTNMAGLSRSLKSTAYLRARRPTMPRRDLSNSSDISVASTGSRSDDHYDLLMSGLNTPAHEKPGTDGSKMPAHSELSFPGGTLLPALLLVSSK